MNVKLLRKVKAHILEEPKRFYMKDFIIRKKEDESGEIDKYPNCGTVGCIAGWACLLEKGMDFKGDVFVPAQKLLELTEGQAERLFCMYTAPREFYGIYAGDQTKNTAKLTAARIEHFIKTKGAE